MSSHDAPVLSGTWLSARLSRPNIVRYGEALRQQWWVLALMVAVGLGAAIAYVSVAHTRYEATADLLVTPVSESDPALVGLALIRDTSDPTADVLTVARLAGSHQIAARAAGPLGISANRLLKQVSATPVTQSDVIAVQASAASAARAAQLANAVANATVAQETDALHGQLDRLIPALKAAAKGLSAAAATSISAELAELETLRASANPTISVSSPANPPTGPSAPKVAESLAGGIVVGLILGLLIVFGRQALDVRLRDEEQLRELFRLPLLARIPRQRAAENAIAPQALSTASEGAFANLRSLLALQHTSTNGTHGRTILVTGDNPGNGKTTVAINLAASLAAAGKQVILIEGDMRRPSIGQSLALRAPHSVTDVLRGRTALLDALVWARPYGPQLELLLADPADQAGADRVSAAAVHRLVAEARASADFVIVDAPPLPAVSEALAFAEAVDHIVLVARLGHSQLRRLSDLGELLSQRGLVPLGVVLVGVPETDVSSYYYGAKPRPEHHEDAFFGLIQRRPEPEFETGISAKFDREPVIVADTGERVGE